MKMHRISGISAACAVALLAGSPGYASVYDDVAGWWHLDGGAMAGNGVISDPTQIRDARRWGITNTPGGGGHHASSISGTPEWTDTGLPASGHGPAGGQLFGGGGMLFNPHVDAATQATTADGFQVNDFSVTGSATLVTRMRWDGHTTTLTDKQTTWLHNNDFKYGDPTTGAGSGWLLGFRGGSGTVNVLFGNRSVDTGWATQEGTWYDLAIVLEDNGTDDQITFYRWGEDGNFQSSTHSVDFVTDLSNNNYTRVGYESPGPDTANAPKSFSGMIENHALWDRALTQDEIHEAMGFARPGWQIGLDNNNTADMRLEGQADADYTIGDPWHEMRRAVNGGGEQTANVHFDLSDGEAGLNHVFQLDFESVGGSGTVAVQVNGTTVRETTVSGRGMLDLVVNADLLDAGSNTITIQHLDGGYVAWDWLGLGGAWHLGSDDGTQVEFAAEASAPDDFYVSNPDLKDLERAMTLSDSDINLHFTLSEALAAYDYIYETEVTAQEPSSGHPIQVFVNGVLIGDLAAMANGTKIQLGIDGDLLQAGDNVITLHFNDPDVEGNNWTQFDYHHFQATQAIPEPSVAAMFSLTLLAGMRRRC